jgi:phage I-like protein
MDTFENVMILPLSQAVDPSSNIIQILPSGWITTEKGTFLVDECALNQIIQSFDKQVNDLVIDYEHQTLTNSIAPAAGWITQLEKRANGLWAKVQWTSRASQYLLNREYRYLSPVVLVSKKDQRALRLHSAALTNTPAIDGMQPIAAKSGFGANNPLDSFQREVNQRLGLSDEDFLKHYKA